jgi:hypothetical protein
MQRLFKQFSFPYGIPSHAAPETPGSINEGGELGYSLAHAYGAVFDNPDLIAACVIGDGEAETGPLATAWHSNKFLNPVRDGAAADPAPQRLEDCQSDGSRADQSRGTGGVAERLRLHALFRRRVRAGDDAPADGPDAGHGNRRDQAHSERRQKQRQCGAPALAYDRPAQSKRVDGPKRRMVSIEGRGGPTRFLWQTSAKNPSTSDCWNNG